MTNSNDKLIRVLDYWLTTELLSQEPYPKVRSIKNGKNKSIRDKRNRLETFLTLNAGDNLYDSIIKEANACKMKQWGNITIYIGEIEREVCIEYLSKYLQNNENADRPEVNKDKIALASLQLSPDGMYIKKSFSLSPILWALKAAKNANGMLSNKLDIKDYLDSTTRLEEKYLLKEDVHEENSLNSISNEVEESFEEIQLFDCASLTIGKLHDLFKELVERYINNVLDASFTVDNLDVESYGLNFWLFENEEIKNKYEDDNYTGLSHNFFVNDLEMVLNRAKNNTLSVDLQDYILSALENNKYKRYDILNPQDLDTYELMLSRILDIRNAPIGKWPSRFMPALMQQVSINLSINKNHIYKGSIFSVNGPPGTGKTTLLKEIVVNNVVERAILLSKYEKPDDAFERCNFLHGSKENNQYSIYISHWYKLKNDKINDYSILVASNNNAAVENITKELPKSVLKDLKPTSNDSELLRSMLNEVSTLFDPSKSTTKEQTKKGETYQDVYFTKYANDLLDTDDSWGLIAAPLGNKRNIKKFLRYVLFALDEDFYKDFNKSKQQRSKVEQRLIYYQLARKEFINQLRVVKNLKAEISDLNKSLSQLLENKLSLKEKEIEIQDLKKVYEKLNSKYTTEVERSTKNKENYKLKQESASLELIDLKKQVSLKEANLKDLNNKLQVIEGNKADANKSVNFIMKLIQKTKYEAIQEQIASYEKEEDILQADISTLQESINDFQNEITQKNNEINSIKSSIREMDKRIDNLNTSVGKASLDIENANIEKDLLEKNVKLLSTQLSGVVKNDEVSNDLDRMTILDTEFISDILSNDDETSTKAQTLNPWFTERYNREREKLFVLAVRMNKEFVLSTNKCRDNLRTLALYWGSPSWDDNEVVQFNREDKDRMVPALFQTLFLLVPVLSSTFASIGNLLKDIKQPGAIGTLIVDEAGQAQPQMAVGALYRSRKALIVGDPRQVEPVVTDDLDLLKQSYIDDSMAKYREKTLSVQYFADSINKIGTYLPNESDTPDWIGCPLLVHRRCISPMFDISNKLSYAGKMKQQTVNPKDVDHFTCSNSRWINVIGNEERVKDHFVKEQGKKVCELLELAFSKNEKPDIFIISPFTTVVDGIRKYIKNYCKNKETNINPSYICESRIGTVHKFQGKEAEEVIFLLGCDNSKTSSAAIRWVNKNIVNVAVTRAKYRLYVIGDSVAWSNNSYVREAKEIMDTFAIKEIQQISDKDISNEEKDKEFKQVIGSLPTLTHFVSQQENDDEYIVDTTGLIDGMNKSFFNMNLTDEMLNQFGFRSIDDLSEMSQEAKDNLLFGIQLYYLLQPFYERNKNMDASCCAILFCKALELHMKDCFSKGLKKEFPNFKIKGFGKGRKKIPLEKAKDNELTLGAFETILKSNINELSNQMAKKNLTKYDFEWWTAFGDRLHLCTERRNNCCHSGAFYWNEMDNLRNQMFLEDNKNHMKGVIFESAVGKKI